MLFPTFRWKKLKFGLSPVDFGEKFLMGDNLDFIVNFAIKGSNPILSKLCNRLTIKIGLSATYVYL